MRTYDIQNRDDLHAMINAEWKYLKSTNKRTTIISKEYRKPKSSAQHRLYWAIIAELQIGFRELGNEFELEEIHEFMKRRACFTKLLHITNKSGTTITSTVTKSISDISDDINSKAMTELIEFYKRWSIENLGYYIRDLEEVCTQH